MSRRSTTPLLVLLCAALAIPSAAWAGSGGAGLGGSSSASGSRSGSSTRASSPTAPTPTTLQRGNVTVTASGDGITLRAQTSAILNRSLTLTGEAPSAAGKTIEIQRSGHQTGWRWANTVHATVNGDGSFAMTWRTNHIGRFAMRAVIVSGSQADAAAATPSLTSTVYRPSVASWYGPGLYGQHTACGQRLTKTLIGVANKTLPCGMKVAIYYRGRTLTVPVVDHGPYVAGRDWDLTAATARALGVGGVATINAVSLPTH